MTRRQAGTAERGQVLTSREHGVLLAIAEGSGNQEIADDLFLSCDTIRTHVARLCEKLGARNRTHAVAIAYHTGLLIPRLTGGT